MHFFKNLNIGKRLGFAFGSVLFLVAAVKRGEARHFLASKPERGVRSGLLLCETPAHRSLQDLPGDEGR